MFSAAFKSLQLVSRQNVRGVVCNLSRPANVLGTRSYSYDSRPTDIGNQPNHIAPGQLAEEGARNEDIETYWKHREFDHVARLPPAPTKYDGRTISLHTIDLARAFDVLNGRMRQNNVIKEVRAQERHEKKGYKRRRLQSERWRRRFAHEVRKKVQLVNEIRARGA